MKKLATLLKKFAEENYLAEGVTLTLESDESGFVSAYMGAKQFDFNSIEELEQILTGQLEPVCFEF